MRHLVVSAALSVLAGSSIAADIQFETLARGTSPRIGVSKVVGVARNAADFNRLWGIPFQATFATPVPPATSREVQFENEMVLAVVLSTHSSGCTSVTIDRVVAENSRLVVQYHPFKHRPDEVCTQAFATAYHFVSVPADLLPVEFQEAANE